MRPFHGRAFCQPVVDQQGDTGPVLYLLRALLRAADPKGLGPGQSGTEDRLGAGVPTSLSGPSPLLPFSSRKPSSSPWLPCSRASPRQVPSVAEEGEEAVVKPRVPEGHLGSHTGETFSKNSHL